MSKTRFAIEKIQDSHKTSKTIPNTLPELVKFLENKEYNFINSIQRQGFDINSKDENGTTILMQAVVQNRSIAELLARSDANIYLKNKLGNTALMLAVEHECFELIEIFIDLLYFSQPLVKIRENINTKNNDHQSALTIAVKKGNTELIEALLNAGGDVEIRDGEGNTLLMIAVKYGHYQVVQKFIDLGIDINAVNADHKSALIIAIEKNHINIVYKLASAKADINLCDKDSNTALLHAVKLKHLDLTAALVDMGADINVQDGNGNTSLMAAMITDIQTTSSFESEAVPRSSKSESELYAQKLVQEKLVQILLAKSPNLEKKDIDGNTTLLLATERGYENIAQMLIDAGANFYVENNEKKTVLEIAAKHQYTNIVSMLIIKHASNERNEEIAVFDAVREGNVDKVTKLLPTKINTDTNIEIKNSSDFTVLMAASLYGHLDIVKLLIEKGVDVNAQDEGGHTALIYAVKSDHQDIVQLLINNNADLSATDAKGNTAMQHAINAENLDMVQLLINKGALILLYHNIDNIENMDINNQSIKNRLIIDVFVRLINKAITSHPNIVMTLIESGQEFDEVFLQQLQEIDKSVFLYETNLPYETKVKYLELLQVVTELIRNGINAQDHEGSTALMLAAKENHTDLIKLLMSRGASIDTRDKKEYTALMHALNKGNLDAMHLLMQEGAEVPTFAEENHDDEVLDEHNYVNLIRKAIRTHPYVVQKLYEAGQRFDEMFWQFHQDHNNLAFSEAVIRSGDLNLVKSIFGLDRSNTDHSTNLKNNNSIKAKIGEIDLAIAVKQGFIDIVKLLLKDTIICPNSTRNRGPVSLMTVIGDGDHLENKIEEFAVEIDYNTKLEILKVLIDSGMNINAKSDSWTDGIVKDMWGYTPLMLAVRKGHIEMVEMLLNAGADINLKEGIDARIKFSKIKDHKRNTALSYAFEADKNNIEIIGMLLKAGADIDASGIDDFVEKYKAIVIEKGIGSDDYYFHIDNIKNYNSLPEQRKEQLINFFTQAVEDFNLECATIFYKLFNISPYPMTQLIELKQEGVKWQKTVVDSRSNDDSGKEQGASIDAQSLIDFYQQHYVFSYNLEEFLKSDILDEQQADVLKREITLANINILKENYQQLLDKKCIDEIETLNKLPLPLELKMLLQKVLVDYAISQDTITTENTTYNVEEQPEHTDDRAIEVVDDKPVEIMGTSDMEIESLEFE